MRRLKYGTAVTGIGCAAVLAFASLAQADTSTSPTNDSALNAAFTAAAKKYDVPRDVLLAIAYTETRIEHHDGPSQDNGFGVMHLESNADNHNLRRAARLTAHSSEDLRDDATANIDGAAAVLRAIADERGLSASQRDRIARWYVPVADYARSHSASSGRLAADAVYENLRSGFSIRKDGERFAASPQRVRLDRGRYATARTPGDIQAQSEDYPPAHWVPASSSNYSDDSRGSGDITHIVMHVTQGSYSGTISWFQNPEAQVSAHYVIRSSDGEVTQMVRDEDEAWHARDGNPYTIGLEHEGYVDDPAWFTEEMYQSSADLTAHLADKYGIPKDREHIVGHNEVPGNDHTDPGPNWDWDKYMAYVNDGEAPPPPPGTSFSTWGSGVNVRADATTQSDVVTSLPGPTNVRVLCQKEGENVSYDGYSGHWWSKLHDQDGFVANIFIDHPDNRLPGVPVC